MFAVIFEVHPGPGQWDNYLGNAKLLRPELEKIDGFVDNLRYRSLTREGWILSLSSWRDEKAVVRWRTRARHHDVQEKGRNEILQDYHLRVGQLTQDTRLPAGCELLEQRLDETQVGDGGPGSRPLNISDSIASPPDCLPGMCSRRCLRPAISS
jgi:heme-degrading monooxygenase HmoA